MEQRTEQPTEQRVEHQRRGRPFQPGTSGNPRGKPSRKAQAAAEEAERRTLELELLADLHREPSVTERIAIETLSAQVNRR